MISNGTGILTVSSHKMKSSSKLVVPTTSLNEVLQQDLDIHYEVLMLAEIEAADPYDQHMFAYIALCVENKFIQYTRSREFKCDECADILLFGDDRINDDLLVMNVEDGGVKQPLYSSMKITIFSSAFMKMFPEEHHSSDIFGLIQKTIVKHIDSNDLFDDVNFAHGENIDEDTSESHKIEFITLMVETLMNLKSQKMCKKNYRVSKRVAHSPYKKTSSYFKRAVNLSKKTFEFYFACIFHNS